MLCHLRKPDIKKSIRPISRIQHLKKIADKINDKKWDSLRSLIAGLALEKYQQSAKPLQLEAAFNLALGINTFVLAGTGFGNDEFQNQLALVVVDEAHIIYQWGLVESGGGKNKVMLLGHVEDQGIFRPLYGKLGARLLTRNNKPILLMSATCRPIAIEGIKKSLKLESHNILIVKGELTRPEIRIIRVQMKESMASCGDLVSIIPRKSEVPDASMVLTLVYNSSRNKTATLMKALDLARGTRGNSMRPKSKFV
ncbi:hypothetical protein MJO28_008913 [Puccinia striiformis f. sp. tritici]|uniref:Uncharacterized protein n=1 Tax=Puccinia striiformis f. sp. tritici TaxID=168172 RepID=A0ACC0ECD0_9BASI|nr:hypothetical protein MJO28_008913 [Puccinia striiformis f. sp. tritici]